MTRTLAAFVTASILSFAGAMASANSLTFINDARLIQSGPNPPVVPAFGSFFDQSTSSPFGFVEQGSLLDPFLISGGSDFFTDPGGGDVHSIFDVSFQVDEDVAYILSGSIHASVPTAASFAELSDSLGNSQPLTGTFVGAGIFRLGVTYRLLLTIDSQPVPGFEAADWSFSLQIPEPALSALTLLGAAWCLRRRLPRGVLPASGR